MHDGRIAGLERRLANLEAKAHTGRFPWSLLDRDLAATKAELDFLRGIRARNLALADEAPQLAADAEARAAEERLLRALRQEVRGLSPDELLEQARREGELQAATAEARVQEARTEVAHQRRRTIRERIQRPKGDPA